MISWFINAIRGFFMALADSVPGVSGGTIAFILGFYDEFITSLDDLFTGSWEKKKKAFMFLIKVGIGWAVGFIIAAFVLTSLFTTKIYQMSSLFLGFLIFAIIIVIKEEKDTLKGKYINLIWALGGFLLVIGITYLNGTDILNIEMTSPSFLTYIYIFIAAALAITAMVLPGISGSTILLIFGLYIPIMNAIKAFLSFDFSVFFILLAFGLGIIFGILAFAKLIRLGLEKKRSAIVYGVIGMMVGSLYSIVMGPTTLDIPLPYLTLDTFSFGFFVLGILVLIALEMLRSILEKRLKKD